MVSPNEPFIAEDGYEYADFAAFLLQEPSHTWRNIYLEYLKRDGRNDLQIKAWSAIYGPKIEGAIKGDRDKGPQTRKSILAYDRSYRAAVERARHANAIFL